jgi:hypothetical protein
MAADAERTAKEGAQRFPGIVREQERARHEEQCDHGE